LKQLVNQSGKTLSANKKNSTPGLSILIPAPNTYWLSVVCGCHKAFGRPKITTMLFTAVAIQF